MTIGVECGRREYQSYVEAWRQRLARQEEQQRVQAERLCQAAEACTRRLVHDFGAGRVYLFGSLIDPARVHRRSDVDLAEEGLAERRYGEALSALWQILPPGADLDLVCLEEAWPGRAERIRTEGEVLDVAA